VRAQIFRQKRKQKTVVLRLINLPNTISNRRTIAKPFLLCFKENKQPQLP